MTNKMRTESETKDIIMSDLEKMVDKFLKTEYSEFVAEYPDPEELFFEFYTRG